MSIGTTAPDASAALDIVSSSKGLLLPHLTAAQVTAIASPATGLLVFQTDGLAGFYYNAGTPAAPSWQQLTTATGAALTFSNGLIQTGSAVGLGGSLNKATTLGLAGYPLGLTGGNVGIGTSTPGHPLTVQAGTSSTSPLLGFYSSAGADKFNFSLAGGGLNLSESGVAGGRLFVQPGGNVGIGTIAPAASALLDLTSTSKGLLPCA